jgi:hypothetical protein
MKSTNVGKTDARAWIADLLRRNWDPIGADNRPEEFTSYVSGVERLIAANVTTRELAEHLVRVETERLGYQDTDPKMLIPVAKKLLRLNLKGGPGEPAA